MKVYVAAPLAAVTEVQAVQAAVVAAGHQLTFDWTRSEDIDVGDSGYADAPEAAMRIATNDLDGALAADAVLVLATEHEGRGTYVELGAALAQASSGQAVDVVLVGEVHHDSVFHHHPLVRQGHLDFAGCD